MRKLVEGEIQMIEVPDDDEIPLWVREGWLRRILPVVAIETSGFQSALSKKKAPNGPRYLVPQDKAIDILVKGRHRAAVWWHAHGYPEPDKYFCFRVDQAEVIGELKEKPPGMQLFLGLEEVGVGYHDANGSPEPSCGHADQSRQFD